MVALRRPPSPMPDAPSPSTATPAAAPAPASAAPVFRLVSPLLLAAAGSLDLVRANRWNRLTALYFRGDDAQDRLNDLLPIYQRARADVKELGRQVDRLVNDAWCWQSSLHDQIELVEEADQACIAAGLPDLEARMTDPLYGDHETGLKYIKKFAELDLPEGLSDEERGLDRAQILLNELIEKMTNANGEREGKPWDTNSVVHFLAGVQTWAQDRLKALEAESQILAARTDDGDDE